MISEFILRNMTSGKEVKFGKTVDCDYYYKSGEIDWGSVPATHNRYSYPGQVGDSISSTKLNSRDISIEGWVSYVMSAQEISNTPRVDRLSYGYKKIKERKAVLNEIINPNDIIRIEIGQYYIEGQPQASVIYGKEDDNNNEYFCKLGFSLLCNNPMFRKKTIAKSVTVGDTPMFHFTWIIPPEGYVMGVRNSYAMVIVENEGDVPVGGKITFKANGEVKNPSVELISTGETIKIMKTMHYGETIVINTKDGKERGVIGGSEDDMQNYFRYWSFSNSWIQFPQGDSPMGYRTENGAESLLTVSVDLNPEKFNLEEM